MVQTGMLSLQALYVVAFIGAGVPGLLLLAVPRLAERWLLFRSGPATPMVRMLGAVWAAFGAVALLGLSDPLKFSPILLLELIYKALWLIVVAIPALLRGERQPAVVFFTLLFGVWCGALLFALPYGHLFDS